MVVGAGWRRHWSAEGLAMMVLAVVLEALLLSRRGKYESCVKSQLLGGITKVIA